MRKINGPPRAVAEIDGVEVRGEGGGERLYEGRRLKTLGDGEGERRIRWAASGGTLWRRQRWGGSGAEGRDGRLGLGGATVRRASIPGGWRWQ